ncbi:hypothetical protein EVAR_663_1 [Eumeta japonica]|uniref:Uncharacterized protein n=1 Tax=Eumeta variegata TaxID=151549 RepID=A0A4C1SBJ3_EUMVA|nr:hypothetical protein EVAR_663_1 [Eumeta japonica]
MENGVLTTSTNSFRGGRSLSKQSAAARRDIDQGIAGDLRPDVVACVFALHPYTSLNNDRAHLKQSRSAAIGCMNAWNTGARWAEPKRAERTRPCHSSVSL